jgi:hypothetical protein
MKHKRSASLNYGKNRIKRPSAVWFIVFGVLLLLFAAFIYFGIKAGEYVENSKADTDTSYISEATE